MAQIIDQIVNISIEDAVSGVSTVDVNTIALVGKVGAAQIDESGEFIGNAGNAGEFISKKAVGDVYGDDSELYALASAVFDQPTQPSKVVCIPIKTAFGGTSETPTSCLDDIKNAAKKYSFYHVVVATDDNESVPGATLANAWEKWLNEVHKIAHVQVKSGASDIMTSLKSKEAKHVAIYQHKEKWSKTEDSVTTNWLEMLHAGIVGYRCGKDSARGSFSHKKVIGITADSYDEQQFSNLTSAGINIYCEVSGEARLFFGTTCDNVHFIDQVAKDDWIRFNIQSRIYALLGEANDGYGVNYDDAGIASVAASVLNVLNVAADTDHQYIIDGSAEVKYKPYSYLKANYADDVKKRNLPLISGSYVRMNTINTVDKVSLQVTL